MKPDEAMCPGCAMPRDRATIKDVACAWCGYDPTKSSRQRRAERRAKERAIRKGRS